MDVPKILAFDFGLSRIGVAESFNTLAEPLEIIPNNANTLELIEKIIAIHKPAILVVGLSEREMADLSRDFAHKLEEHFSLPVHYMDENLSSKEVHQRLAQRDRKHRQYKGPIDHYAAALILQNYLDEYYD